MGRFAGEIRAVIGVHLGRVDVIANPIVDTESTASVDYGSGSNGVVSGPNAPSARQTSAAGFCTLYKSMMYQCGAERHE
jgi:hypothetical protein